MIRPVPMKVFGVGIWTDTDLPESVMQLRNPDGSGLQWDSATQRMTTLPPRHPKSQEVRDA